MGFDIFSFGQKRDLAVAAVLFGGGAFQGSKTSLRSDTRDEKDAIEPI